MENIFILYMQCMMEGYIVFTCTMVSRRGEGAACMYASYAEDVSGCVTPFLS